MDRKEFLTVLTALAGTACITNGADRQPDADSDDALRRTGAGAVPQATSTRFAERLLGDVARTFAVTLAFIGDQLGLFAGLTRSGPCSAVDLAKSTELHPRLVHEWLDGMVAAGYVSYAPQTSLYHLPADHTAALVDENAPHFSAGLFNLAIPLVMASHPVMESFRTGRPVTPDAFHSDLWRGIERYSAPAYRHRLVQHWLPSLPAVVATLKAGGALADVGCGAGRAAITMTTAFPTARVSGFDPYAPAIARARENAVAAGVADRVVFQVGGARDLPERRFDVITTFDVVHHYSDPVSEMAAVRRALTDDGAYLIFDATISDRVDENANPWGVFIYGTSVLYCLHDSLAHNGAGLGADFSEPRVRNLAARAGFQQFRRVTVDDPTVALYELKA